MVARIRAGLGFGLVLALLGAGFASLGVLAGLVAPEGLPFWPRPAVTCAVVPTYELRETGTGAWLRVGGDLDLAALNARLAARGHDLVVEEVPVAGSAGRVTAVLPRDATALPAPLTTGIGVPPEGASQVLLGPDTAAGGWIATVECPPAGEPAASAARRTP